MSPVVKRGATEKVTYLPAGRYVDWETLEVVDGGQSVTTPAPLDALPMWLVEGQMVPLLDPSIDTLAPAAEPGVVTPDQVAGVLDVRVALGPGQTATLALADGTTLTARRLAADEGNPGGLPVAADAAEVEACEGCYLGTTEGDVARLRVTTESAESTTVTLQDVELTASGPSARRIRWDVLRTSG